LDLGQPRRYCDTAPTLTGFDGFRRVLDGKVLVLETRSVLVVEPTEFLQDFCGSGILELSGDGWCAMKARKSGYLPVCG
jgi:hypothetical protein